MSRREIKKDPEEKKCYTYILKCSDDTYYTGWTTDLQRRTLEHNRGTAGAKYTRSRRPVRLVYYEAYPSRREAMSREYQIKQLSHMEKDALIHRCRCYGEL